MKKVAVELQSNGYEIRIGSGLLPQVGRWLGEMGLSGKAVIITDTTVRGLYADALTAGLTDAGFRVEVIEVPAGEETAGRELHVLIDPFFIGRYVMHGCWRIGDAKVDQ